MAQGKVDPGAHGPLNALGAVGVGGRPPAQTVGLLEEDPQLLSGELGEPGGGTIGHEAAGGHGLDRVSAHEVVVADLATDLVQGVRGASGVVGVSTGRGDLRPGGDDPGPAQVSGVDGVTQGDVNIVARPEGLDAGDALAEQLAGGAGSVEGEAGDLVRPVVGVFDVGPGGGKVIVGLDEPGHEGGAGQVQAHDLARVDVGNELAQAPFELRGGPRCQDLAPPHEDGSAAAGCTGAGVVGPAEDLEAALGLAALSGEDPVRAYEGDGSPVKSFAAVGGRGGPADGLRCGRGPRRGGGVVGVVSGLLGHGKSLKRGWERIRRCAGSSVGSGDSVQTIRAVQTVLSQIVLGFHRAHRPRASSETHQRPARRPT